MIIEENVQKKPIVYVLSDSIGETAELVARAAVSQFNSGHTEIKRIPYINDKDAIETVLQEAKNYRSVIAYTLLSKELRVYLEEQARIFNIVTIDILGPMLEALGAVLEKKPKLEPGIIHRMDEEYFRRVEAIEFAVKFDDGKDPRGLFRADIVLIGVSRTSKTPLSMYLANKRWKVANVPLVPEVPVPDELFQIPSNKIVGLTINPHELFAIREARLKVLGLGKDADYANLERILMELEYAEGIMRRLRCPVINVTKKAIEETANEIIETIKKGEKH